MTENEGSPNLNKAIMECTRSWHVQITSINMVAEVWIRREIVFLHSHQFQWDALEAVVHHCILVSYKLTFSAFILCNVGICSILSRMLYAICMAKLTLMSYNQMNASPIHFVNSLAPMRYGVRLRCSKCYQIFAEWAYVCVWSTRDHITYIYSTSTRIKHTVAYELIAYPTFQHWCE